MKALLMGAKAGGGKSPVCRVCGDESSGFHYGVDSCEGCKGFFRRCITTGMTHNCANDEKCEITPFTRNSCQYCRLKKCFQVGMAREASRLGRRPKRLKEASGESSRSHTTNLPIAPYPSIQELTRLRMAELQKLIQAKGTETSELMKLYLSEAQHSFREHAKTSHNPKLLGSSSSAAIITSNFNLADNNGNSNFGMGNPTTGSLSQQTGADINLNVRPPSSGNMNLTSGPPGSEFITSGSPSSSLQAHSPFLDLGLADLSPLPGGLNLNLGFDNMVLPPSNTTSSANNLNGNNSAYSPSTQSLTDNIANSPMIMPNLDNLDPCSPSEFFTGNMTTTSSSSPESTSTAASTRNANMNLMANTAIPSGASVCPPPNLDNLNANMGGSINANIVHQHQHQHQQQHQHSMLSPGSIKQEPVDTTHIKTEPTSEPSPCQGQSSSEPDAFTLQNRLSDVDRVLAEAQMTPEDSRLLLLNQVTDIIVEAHMGTTVNTHANVTAAKERIAGCKLDPDDMIPDMSKLSLSAADLWQQFLTALVPEITKVVKFSKKLPAFSDFPQADQIKLIKQGAFEVMVARYSILVDEVNELMLDPKLEMMSPRSVIGDLPMGPFLDEFFNIAKKFNPLCLTDGEIGLFTAVLMICPDRNNLEGRDAIARIQDLILQALYLLMKQNTTRTIDAETSFRSLITMIGHFRKVNEDHARFLNNIKMKSPSEFNQQFPALHQEVFDDGNNKKGKRFE